VAEAQANLGSMYESGRGVAQDFIEAARWFLKSAEQGNEYAQAKLREGIGRSDTCNKSSGSLELSNSSGQKLIQPSPTRTSTGTGSTTSSKWVAIDFETANKSRSSACSVGLVIGRGDRIEDSCRFLIKPPSNYFEFTYIHGISWNDVRYASRFDEVWPEIFHIIKNAKVLAAHNAAFDRSVLIACCERYGISPPATPWVCTYKDVAKKLWPTLINHKLNTVCDHLSIKLNHHEALSDALACAEILKIGISGGRVPI